jgi:hypothetical protein
MFMSASAWISLHLLKTRESFPAFVVCTRTRILPRSHTNRNRNHASHRIRFDTLCDRMFHESSDVRASERQCVSASVVSCGLWVVGRQPDIAS